MTARLSRRPVFIDVLVLATAAIVCAPIGWYALYSRLATVDDETFFLLPIRLVAAGGRLYDDVYNSYGPFYFDAFVPLSRLIGGISHDRGRLIVLVLWLVTSMLCGGAAMRLTGRRSLAVAAVALEFAVLAPLVYEPMNPGALLAVLIIGMALIATWGAQRWTLLTLGALGAAAALTKLNVGGYALVAVWTALLWMTGSRRTSALAAGAAFIVVPCAVLIRDFGNGDMRRFALSIAVAGFAVVGVICAGRKEPARGTGAAARTLVVGSAAVVVGVFLLTIAALGSSPHELASGALVEPLRVSASFKVLPLVGTGPPLMILLGAAVAWLFASGRLAGNTLARGLASLTAGVVLALSIVEHAFQPPEMTTLWYGMTFAWLAVLPDPRGRAVAERTRFARAFLAVLAVLMPLYAYPVAGSQAGFGSAPLALLAAVLLADGIRATQSMLAPRMRAVYSAVCVSAAAALSLWGAAGAHVSGLRAAYGREVPLPFAGATRIHADPEVVGRLEWTVHHVAGCRQLVTVPGLSQIYWFSGKQPPEFLPQVWMKLLDTERQEGIVRKLAAQPKSCAVVDTAALAFWTHGKRAPSGPVIDYLHRDFRETDRSQGMIVLRKVTAS